MDKSELLMPTENQHLSQQLAAILGCKIGEFPFTYLGLPLSDRKLPKTAYMTLIQKVSTRLQGWAASKLSIAGRVVLINSVLSSIPTYFMSVFKLPCWAINEIDKIRRAFLWKRNSVEGRGIHLANWDLVCKPKKLGGMGIIDLRSFNDALLAKWYWYWVKPTQSLWKSIILAAHDMDRPSSLPESKFFKQVLSKVQNFCDCFLMRTLGDGTRVRFWTHNWGFGLLYTVYPILFNEAKDKEISVYQAYLPQNISNLFHHTDSDEFLEQLERFQAFWQNPIQFSLNEDDAVWTLSPSGTFTVRSAYFGLKNRPCIASDIHRVWKLKVQPRLQIFGWLVFYRKILTAENLEKRGWQLPSMCVMCRCSCETIHHLFSTCQFALHLYGMLNHVFDLPVRDWKTVLEPHGANQWFVGKGRDKKSAEVILIAMFIIWRERCARIFRETSKGLSGLIAEVQEQWNYTH